MGSRFFLGSVARLLRRRPVAPTRSRRAGRAATVSVSLALMQQEGVERLRSLGAVENCAKPMPQTKLYGFTLCSQAQASGLDNRASDP